MPLLTSGNPTYVVSGLIVMGIALVPALLGWRLRRGPRPPGDQGDGGGWKAMEGDAT
jgi:hypothetical protein